MKLFLCIIFNLSIICRNSAENSPETPHDESENMPDSKSPMDYGEVVSRFKSINYLVSEFANSYHYVEKSKFNQNIYNEGLKTLMSKFEDIEKYLKDDILPNLTLDVDPRKIEEKIKKVKTGVSCYSSAVFPKRIQQDPPKIAYFVNWSYVEDPENSESCAYMKELLDKQGLFARKVPMNPENLDKMELDNDGLRRIYKVGKHIYWEFDGLLERYKKFLDVQRDTEFETEANSIFKDMEQKLHEVGHFWKTGEIW
ncbi:hypothetical protein Ddc_09877 [Ditylenchus destructor]|nr:hypothetical protein Ddc_09877 [Ditylenchus destructor]